MERTTNTPHQVEVGKVMVNQHSILLYSGLHKLLAKHAHVLWAYTTYFRAELKYTGENDDKNHSYVGLY